MILSRNLRAAFAQPEMGLEGHRPSPGLHARGSHDKQVMDSFITVVSESKEIIDFLIGRGSTVRKARVLEF